MNLVRSALSISLLSGLSMVIGHAGEIQGTVKVIPGLTKKRVTLPSYQFRGVAVPQPHAPNTADEMSRVVIYVDGSALGPGSPISAEIRQRERRFEPEILAAPIGSTISFPNQDPIFHNVFSLSKTKQFDLGYYPAGQTRTIRMDKAGIVQVYCHLHSDMSAAILVVPNQFFTRPNTEGHFHMTGLPAGQYKIIAWHKSAGLLIRTIRVPDQGVAEIEFDIPVVDDPEGH